MDVGETVSQVSPKGVNSWMHHHSCKLCGYKTLSPEHLAAHTQTGCHGEQPYACSLCNYRASREKCLKHHQGFHGIKTPHPCPKCSYSAYTTKQLTRHQNQDHGSKRKGASSEKSLKYRCPHCPFRCNTPGSLRTHQEKHEIKSAYQCDLCSFSSVSISGVSYHHNRVHRNEPPPSRPALPAKVKEEQPKRLRTYRCRLCGYLSYASAKLAKHELAHRVKSAHQCRLCSFSAKSASRLERHVLRDHPRKKSETRGRLPNDSGERPFPCSQCDYRALRPSDLRKHLLKHRMRAAHQCQLCSYSSNTANHVSFHRIRHHKPGAGRSNPQPNEDGPKRSSRKEPGMTYGCNQCGFWTGVLTNLRSHVRNHLRKKTNQCPLCSYSSGCKRVLNEHLERDHRNELSAHHQDPGINYKEADKILAEVKRHPAELRRIDKKKITGETGHICGFCDYKTNHSKQGQRHRMMHSWNERFRCPLCNYSSKVQKGIVNHLRLHHRDGQKKKDRSVRQRAEVMRGKVRLLQDDVDRLSAKRKDTHRRKEEALAAKTRTETAVRALEAEVDRLRQLIGKESPDLTEEATTKDLLDAERKVQLSMEDLQERADEVEGVAKEEEEMEEELTSAQESLFGAEQVLSILEREMELM